MRMVTVFLSTPSARRATFSAFSCAFIAAYFYPRPLRGGRRDAHRRAAAAVAISIHALCEEGDGPLQIRDQPVEISIHALCEEGDMEQTHFHAYLYKFLSTPSARRATISPSPALCTPSLFLSTPSARRATCSGATLSTDPPNFYPRPLRGGRQVLDAIGERQDVFLSTPSARRATCRRSPSGRCCG